MQTLKTHFFLNFAENFFCFCIFSSFNTKNDKNAYFNERFECVAPKPWSKYTTQHPSFFKTSSQYSFWINWLQNFGFDINEAILESGNTPLMVAIIMADNEDGLVRFIRRIYDEFKNSTNPLNLNKQNNDLESAAW